jgi:hypothetical protein
MLWRPTRRWLPDHSSIAVLLVDLSNQAQRQMPLGNKKKLSSRKARILSLHRASAKAPGRHQLRLPYSAYAPTSSRVEIEQFAPTHQTGRLLCPMPKSL